MLGIGIYALCNKVLCLQRLRFWTTCRWIQLVTCGMYVYHICGSFIIFCT